jgi:hypothetical protein
VSEDAGRHWGPTLFVAATVLVLAAGLPMLDGYVDRKPDYRTRRDGHVELQLEGQPLRPGTSTNAASFVPSPGWREVGSSTSAEDSTVLVSTGASLEVRLVPATSAAQCREVEGDARGSVRSDLGVEASGVDGQFVTVDGVTGLVTGYSSALVDGLVFVACADGAALVATASAPVDPLSSGIGDVDDMMASVRFR